MQPIVKPLSEWRRKFVFGTLLLAFLISLPAFIFYAAGYRYDFMSKSPVLTVTGGFYISAEAVDQMIYIDDMPVKNVRTFRNAFYVQGLELGLHRVHVQAPGLHTWVKELTIYPHIVTEVDAFNLPLVPQVRLVTNYLSPVDGSSIILPRSSSTPVLTGSASTTPFIVASSAATSTLRENQEFALLTSLFTEKASTSALIKKQRDVELLKSEQFTFATSVEKVKKATTSMALATTTIESGNLRLYEKGDNLFAGVISEEPRLVPHYFCNRNPLPIETLERIELDVVESEVTVSEEILVVEPSLCRSEIRLDTRWQTIQGFDFYPSDSNLVVVHLEDGIYLVEIDDRSWQNVQLIYPGQELNYILYRGSLFIKEKGVIFEVLTDLESK